MRTPRILALVALLAGAPAAAQQGDPPAHDRPMMQQRGAQQCMDMLGGPHPQMLLHHREALGLTADQVTRLEALRDEAGETASPHMQPLMQAHTAAAELLKQEAPDFEAYEARLREGADHMVQAHVAMARVAVQAGQVLTAEQRETLDELAAGGGMMPGARQGMMSGGGRHAGMGGEGGMMMGCMMMESGPKRP